MSNNSNSNNKVKGHSRHVSNNNNYDNSDK